MVNVVVDRLGKVAQTDVWKWWLGRLSAETIGGHLRAPPGKLRRQSRADALAGTLAFRAVVFGRHRPGRRSGFGPRRGASQMRSRHGNGSRVHRTAGNRGRTLRASAGRAGRDRASGVRPLSAAGPRRSVAAKSHRLRGGARGQA